MKTILISFIFLFSLVAFAQQGDGGEPNGYNYFIKTDTEIPTFYFDKPDVEKLRAEDKINDSLKNGPWRFGINNSTSINLLTSAIWRANSKGDKIGILKITSDQAQTINLTFSNTTIPEGNELYIYNPDKSFILGKFIQNHIYKGQLGTELVPGNTVYVEYFVPARNSETIGNVEISKVTHGYRTAREYQTKAFGTSASCNMNVNCPDGAPYASQRNSTLMIVVGSSGFCTGALINNTQFDGKPYVLTANHCTFASVNSDIPNWIFRFNWQSPDCNNPASSPSFQSLSGSIERARRVPSDFLLVEITGGLENGKVPESYSPYYAGWDRGDTPPQSSYSIHHPTGDIKKISIDDDPAIAIQAMGSTEANSTWRVIWDRNTTTQWGSSGSPLFNQDGQIIGQLWGGNASCSPTSLDQDYYGRVHNSWEPLGSENSSQLKHWLDPTSSGSEDILGYDPYNTPLDYNISVQNLYGVEGQTCEESNTPRVKVVNNGDVTVTSFEIKYSYNNAPVQTLNWSGSLSLYSYTTIELPLILQMDGENTIEVNIVNPNGNADQDMSDNQMNLSYFAAPNGTLLDFEFYLGCYADEVSWELKDENGAILYSGDDYISANAANLVTEEFCLPNGCYQLVLKDSYGDGVEGAIHNQCNYTGSMTLTNKVSGEIVATLSEAEANFGFEIAYDFCTQGKVEEKEFKIFPNPSDGNFKVEMDLEGQKTVTLVALTGQIIGTYEVKTNYLIISKPHLSAGMYIVNVRNSEKSVSKKISVK
ncbi:T9SS type A sorting domain-containing protein [Brumimicrobium mesophilum]|uniref:T9SS type A sorting domain-containing protein n=1 Tax=Brumimicrobium mesophilum TaxID=392717 RepID=UPI000D1441F5|nr:T9SS type A sorting domain-containing protein [Brumimicrobium mesophilum]